MSWHHAPIPRLVIGALVGVAVGAPVGASLGVAAGIVSGWGAAALTLSAWVLIVVWPMDATATKKHARREDPGRKLARIITAFASVASLGAVVAVLLQSHNAPRQQTYVLAAMMVGSVIASWLVIQVEYMLRYAHLYYGPEHGGIDFNNDEPPQYSDFAYLSAGLGMTYQVADTNISTTFLRKVVLAQTLLGYLFGAVILATIINLVTSLA